MFELALLLCGGWPRVLEIFFKEARTWKGLPECDIAADDLLYLMSPIIERLRSFTQRGS